MSLIDCSSWDLLGLSTITTVHHPRALGGLVMLKGIERIAHVHWYAMWFPRGQIDVYPEGRCRADDFGCAFSNGPDERVAP